MHADRWAVVDEDWRFTYAEFHQRALRLAGMLRRLGATPGTRVAVLAPNTHMLLESHYGVPLAGAVLVALNMRLNADELAYIVEHSGSKILLHDQEFGETARRVAQHVGGALRLVEAGGLSSEYEERLAAATPWSAPCEDEGALLSINYTSGTTGKPKGVMYHHRGAYLQALVMALHARLDPATVYLWTLPMFHCNGWCFTWAVTAAGGLHLCLRKVDPPTVWRLIRERGVTHFCGAPTVLTALAYHPQAGAPAAGTIRACTGGAPPAPTLLARLAELHIDATHVYGLTETFGPVAVCDWRPEWDRLLPGRRAELKARQGVGNIISERMRVLGQDGRDVPADGTTVGEVAIRGNNVMLGYYRDPEATREAAPDGWFRSGDLGVLHPDGYVELKDRAKDVIISGGENIASIEVEQAVMSHPAVLEAAVIAVPDATWGEVPAAYVTLKEGASASEADIIAHVRGRLAHFKAPKQVSFGPLPKTSTGKIQKYVLREQAWAGQEKRIH